MVQSLVVLILFAGALFFLGRLVYKQLTAKSGCASGCGDCQTIDFKRIEKELSARFEKQC